MGCSPFELIADGSPLPAPYRAPAGSGEGFLTRYVRWESQDRKAEGKEQASAVAATAASGIAAPITKPARDVCEIEVSGGNASGEYTQKLIQHTIRGWFDFSEVDKFVAKATGDGSTLTAESRALWSGETLGGDTKRSTLVLPGGFYRGILTISMQSGRSRFIYADPEGGFAQRLLPVRGHSG
jgi:hypothetical protein